MKNILGCISLLCMALWIQAQSITEIEYYFNTDPGIGNGKKLPAMAEIESTIDISGLEEGIHTKVLPMFQTTINTFILII